VTFTVKLPPLEVARATLIVVVIGFGCFLLWQLQEVLFLLTRAGGTPRGLEL